MTVTIMDKEQNTDFSVFDEEDLFGESSSKTETKTEANVSSNNVSAVVTPFKDIGGMTSPSSHSASSPSLDGIPQLRGDGFPSAFVSMVERVQDQYRSLPFLDHELIYSELRDLTVKCRPTPTLQILNAEIQKVQGAKDRLSEIYVDICRHYFFKKRMVDVLKESWGKYTDEKNAEKRKGDGAFRLSDFEVDFAQIESLFRAITHIVRNLDSLHDSLSRRITIYQSLLKMHDVGRGALPDFDFDKNFSGSLDNFDGNSGNSDVDPSQGIDAVEETF